MRRRDVIVGCGALAGTATLPGCSALPFGGDDGGQDASEYADWIPTVDAPSASFSAVRHADIAAVDGLPEGFLQEEVLGVPAEDVDQEITLDRARVLEGSFDAATVRDGVEAEDVTLQQDGEYQGYQRYAFAETDGVTVGLGDGTAVLAPTDLFERLVDANRGDAERLVDANEDFELLVDELGVADVVTGTVLVDGDTDEPRRADGQRVDIRESDSERTHVVVFATESGVDEEGVRADYAERAGASNVTSSVDGRVVTVSYTEQTDQSG